MDEKTFISRIEDLGFVRGLIDEDSDSIVLTKVLSEEGIDGSRIDVFSNPDNPGEWRIGYFEDSLDACGNAFSVFESGKELLTYLHGAWGVTEKEIYWDSLVRWLLSQ